LKSALVLTKTKADPVARTLPPGSEWLYAKLYGGAAALDDVLTTAIPQLLRAGFERGLVSRWFFLRFADPQEHVRIRFQGPPDRLGQEFLPLISSAFRQLLASGRIWKIQFDTYEREIERYGGVEGTALGEAIFFAD